MAPNMSPEDISLRELEKCAALLKKQAKQQAKQQATQRSPPSADTVVSMLRSATLDDDYFHRRALYKICTQRSPIEDFLPQASEIVPNLFVSDLYTATSPAALSRLGITHVVSVVAKPDHRYPRPLAHLCVPLDDRGDADLLDYLDGAVDWMRAALDKGGRVLVHCVWGMSRSASVAIAFLIAARRMSLRDAHALARAKRRVVRPNSGFLNQLSIFERVTRLREAHARRTQPEEKKAEATVTVEEVKGQLDPEDLARRIKVVSQKGYLDASDLDRRMGALVLAQS